MNVDFREVLRQAWQITWKHKALWFFGALPMVPVLFYLPLIFYFFLSDDVADRIPDVLRNPTLIALSFIVILITAAISLVLQVFGRSAITFGIHQIETGSDRPTFGEISRGGRRFFWPVLGVMLLARLMMTVVFAAVSACLSLVGLATFGLGSLVGQVLFLPVSLLAYAVMEQSQAAVVADAIGPTRAIERAWQLIVENLNLFAPLSAVLYIGLSVAGSLALLPVMAPLLLLVFERFTTQFSYPSLLEIGIVCFVVFLPVYLVYQAVSMVYVRAVHVIVYLRLTRSSKLQPLP